LEQAGVLTAGDFGKDSSVTLLGGCKIKMTLKRFMAGTVLAAMVAGVVPAASLVSTAPARADGAASTRNILLLGGAAATYLIIQHNKKVHAQEAEASRQQAAAQESSSNAWAAYSSETKAYNNEVALNSDLKREVAYQHSVIAQQQKQLASAGMSPVYIAQHSTKPTQPNVAHASSQQVALTSYGWGTI
jgi:hypothetical protein